MRDIYDGGDYLVLVTTDRQSAFDRVLASIPFKGQVFVPSFIASSAKDLMKLFSCVLMLMLMVKAWFFRY